MKIARGSYANVTATLALLVALGGTSYAAAELAKNSVGAKQLKANAVSSKKVKDGSLLSQDFAAGQLVAGPRGPAGAAGAVGATGPAGATGATGEKGLIGARGPAGAKGDTGPRGEQGEQGEKGEQGDPGEQGEQGDQGDPGALLAAVPSGETLVGHWGVTGTVPADQAVSTSISYTFPVLGDVEPIMLPLDSSGSLECPGTAEEPAAAPGHLCIFTDASVNGRAGAVLDNRLGAQVFVHAQESGLVLALGSWAVTAP